MKTFEYKGIECVEYLFGTDNPDLPAGYYDWESKQFLGTELIPILNQLGAQSWDVLHLNKWSIFLKREVNT